MRDRVLKTVSKVLNVPVPELNDASSPQTVANWDSLKHMNLILTLEEEFGITFTDGEIVKMLNLQKIVETVDKKASQSV